MQGEVLMSSGEVLSTPTSFVLEYFFFALQNGNLGAGGVKGGINFLGV